jgi:hypothetical protein
LCVRNNIIYGDITLDNAMFYLKNGSEMICDVFIGWARRAFFLDVDAAHKRQNSGLETSSSASVWIRSQIALSYPAVPASHYHEGPLEQWMRIGTAALYDKRSAL